MFEVFFSCSCSNLQVLFKFFSWFIYRQIKDSVWNELLLPVVIFVMSKHARELPNETNRMFLYLWHFSWLELDTFIKNKQIIYVWLSSSNECNGWIR